MKNKFTLRSCILFLGLAVLVNAGCKKNFPDVRESLGDDSRFLNNLYEPVLGRNTLFSNNFFVGSSSQPLTFKIINLRKRDGTAATELTAERPVLVWKKPYLGDEKSLAEIEEKRAVENHPAFEIREHSGQFLMWANSKSDNIKTQPDSGYVFDVEMSNKGGRRYFRDMKLRPLRERPFEPSNLDPLTGLAQKVAIRPNFVVQMRGEKTSRFLSSGDVEVFFNKVSSEKKSLTFKFVDSLYRPIDPNKFALTDWNNLVHGFNMQKTSEYVRYDVAYPVPLIAYATKYTNPQGDKSRVIFRYERLAFGGFRESGYLGLDFSIFEIGEWEITFRFSGESPKFIND